MLILGRSYDMNQLDAYGFFTDTVEDDAALLPAAEDLAAQVVNQPPVPVTLTKASINAQSMPLGRAIQHMDHVAVGYMGKSDSSRTARTTYFDNEQREWSDD
jgi:enoyl-CoA hydratase/carnithine racemase